MGKEILAQELIRLNGFQMFLPPLPKYEMVALPENKNSIKFESDNKLLRDKIENTLYQKEKIKQLNKHMGKKILIDWDEYHILKEDRDEQREKIRTLVDFVHQNAHKHLCLVFEDITRHTFQKIVPPVPTYQMFLLHKSEVIKKLESANQSLMDAIGNTPLHKEKIEALNKILSEHETKVLEQEAKIKEYEGIINKAKMIVKDFDTDFAVTNSPLSVLKRFLYWVISKL